MTLDLAGGRMAVEPSSSQRADRSKLAVRDAQPVWQWRCRSPVGSDGDARQRRAICVISRWMAKHRAKTVNTPMPIVGFGERPGRRTSPASDAPGGPSWRLRRDPSHDFDSGIADAIDSGLTPSSGWTGSTRRTITIDYPQRRVVRLTRQWLRARTTSRVAVQPDDEKFILNTS